MCDGCVAAANVPEILCISATTTSESLVSVLLISDLSKSVAVSVSVWQVDG